MLNFFKDKKLRYGTFSTLTAVFVIAILLVVNLVAGQLDKSFDLSKDKIYSLSDTTKEILNELKEEVTIYALFRTGQENALYSDLLNQYPELSSNIKLVVRDPYLYPQFVEKYATDGETIPADSVIVESARRFKVIKASEMVTYDYNYETFQQYIKSVDAEPKITNTIKYVTDEVTSVVYEISGHNEQPLNDGMKELIKYANFEVKELDLLMADSIPEDADVIIATTPTRDWTADEAQRVKDFLQQGGRAIFFMDYMGADLSNVQSMLNSYGVNLGEAVVVEGNTSNFFSGNPVYLIPNYTNHDINTNLTAKGYRTLMPIVRDIETLDVKRNSILVEPLLVTSNQSYGKTNPNSESINKEPGDIDGPFELAVAVTDSIYTDKQYTTKLVVVGSSYLLDENINSYVAGANGDFLVSCVNWLQDKTDSVFIMPKTSKNSQLVMNQQQALLIMLCSVIILPLIIFGWGLVVWLRRRNS